MSTNGRKTYIRIAAISTSVMMFLTAFAVIPMTDIGKVYAVGETAKVTATSLNVRSGAGTKYSIIGSLKKGKTFTVKGSAKDKSGDKWYKLTYSSKTGYVSSEYVDIIKPTVTPLTNTKGTVTNNGLKVRSGPGGLYTQVGTLSKNKVIDITGKSKDSSGLWWYQFTYNGKTAYVSSNYIKLSEVKPEPEFEIIALKDAKGTVTANGLTVRSGPSGTYSKLGTLAKNTKIDVTGKVQDKSGLWWYQFTYNGKTAYVSSNYTKLTELKPEPEYEVITLKDTKGTVTAGGLTVRSGPAGTYSKIGTIDKGSVVDVTGKSKDKNGLWWYQFTYSGKTAYVSSNYMTLTELKPVPEYEVTTLKNTKGTVTANGLTVRTGPSGSYSKLGTLSKNTIVDVTGKVQDKSGLWWYQFAYNGKTAYVSSNYMTIKVYESVSVKIGTVTSEDGLNVRNGAGTSYTKLTVLAYGSTVTITGSSKDSSGKVWYKYQYSSSKVGYICSDYVKVKTITSDSEFEAYMDKQGFPESYKAGLRTIHAEHPQWVFKAVKVGYSWSDAVSKESKVGINLVSPSSPTSYRNSETYNSSTKTWKKYDGSWYAANKTVVEHYMDPRNFLNESGIYQFMTHTYDSKSQNADTVAAVIKGSFMQSKNPGGGYTSYATLIHDAGKNSGVNPNVLASMIIQEQGWNGSSLVSGTYSGYAGYYNFFNIGAYTTSTMNAVQRGLWYAKGGDDKSTSYSRPWNTPYKSILGGAQFYSEDYVSNNQDSYYSKKFNVYNGLSNVASHQYMTNVSAAASEGGIVKKAYASNDNYPIVFEIPVYKNMPAAVCPLP